MCMQSNALHLIFYFALIYMQLNAFNLIKNYIIFIYMQFNVHKFILVYTVFIYMQFNALLIHCLFPFNVYNYIFHVRLHNSHVLFSLYGCKA